MKSWRKYQLSDAAG